MMWYDVYNSKNLASQNEGKTVIGAYTDFNELTV